MIRKVHFAMREIVMVLGTMYISASDIEKFVNIYKELLQEDIRNYA